MLSKKNITFLILFTLTIAICFGIFNAHSTEKIEPTALAACFHVDSYSGAHIPDPTCMTNTVKVLLKTYTAKELLAFTVSSTTSPIISVNCHAIGHVIGRSVFKVTQSTEAALSACSDICRAGCMHGALAASVLSSLGESYDEDEVSHASTSTLLTLGKKYCEGKPHLCHGVGHLLYLKSRNLASSLELCKQISDGFSLEACYMGIFMELAGPTESLFLENNTLDITSAPAEVCTSLNYVYQHSCFQFLPVIISNSISSGKGNTTIPLLTQSELACSRLEGSARNYCFEGIGASWRFFKLTINTLPSLCSSLHTITDESACVLGPVSTLGALQQWPQLHHLGIISCSKFVHMVIILF